MEQAALVDESRKDLQAVLEDYDLRFPADGETFPAAIDLPHIEIEGTVELSLRRHTYQQALEQFTHSREMLREMIVNAEEAQKKASNFGPTMTLHTRAD